MSGASPGTFLSLTGNGLVSPAHSPDGNCIGCDIA